eukprot:gene73-670_t
MPQFRGVHLLLLVLALPAQYLISKWMTPSTSDREYMTRRLVNGIQNHVNGILSIEVWKSLLIRFLKYASVPYSNSRIDDTGECVAKEVFLYKNPNGYFAGSPEPRSQRPSNIAYRVGQVIRHKKFGYRGVIVGWDKKAKAPDSWLSVNFPNPETRKQPAYAVLVHTSDKSPAQITYVTQENIEVIAYTEIEHPEISEYFDSFDNAQYILRPWLRKLYPHD